MSKKLSLCINNTNKSQERNMQINKAWKISVIAIALKLCINVVIFVKLKILLPAAMYTD